MTRAALASRGLRRRAAALGALAVAGALAAHAAAPARLAPKAPAPARAPLARSTSARPAARGVPLAPAPPGRESYATATAPYAFHFPRDHASHPEYRTEWWYYTGEVAGRGRSFGFELTFFRVGLDRARARSRSAWAPRTLILAHAALTDETRRTFVYDETIARTALGLAGADTSRYRVWAGDWSVGLSPGGAHALRAAARSFALDLDLTPLKPPAIHGEGGLSRKGAAPGEASHYYSLTRLAARGRIVAGRDTLPVLGEAWMDHEFGSGVLGAGQVGWDWFAVRLDDDRELMLYVLRLADGTVEPQSSGSLVDPNGAVTHLPRDAFAVAPTARWRSPHSGASYPGGWRIRVPRERLDVTLDPTVADQELVTRTTGGVTYWEGAVRVRGTRAGRAVSGRGYVELTGYAGPPPSR